MTGVDASFAAVIESAYVAACSGDSWTATLASVARFVGGTGAMRVHHDFGRNHSSIEVANLRQDLSRLYIDRYAANPFALAAMTRPPGVCLASELADMATVRRSEFGADILVPQHNEDIVMLSHPRFVGGTQSGGFGVTLNLRQAENKGEARARLDRLAPHLVRALDLALSTPGQRRGSTAAARILSALPDAALIVDGEHTLLDLNAAAQRLLDSGRGLALQGTSVLRVIARRARCQQLFSAAVGAATRRTGEGTPRGSVLRLGGTDEPDGLLVSVAPLPLGHAADFSGLSTPVAALVRVSDPVGLAARQAGVFAKLHGLTAAETRVVGLVCAGVSVPQTAAILGISANTVRTHLTRCFDKTGVRSQTELARLMALVPVAPE